MAKKKVRKARNAPPAQNTSATNRREENNKLLPFHLSKKDKVFYGAVAAVCLVAMAVLIYAGATNIFAVPALLCIALISRRRWQSKV